MLKALREKQNRLSKAHGRDEGTVRRGNKHM